MHAGLNRPDRSLSPGGMEAAQVARELAAIGPLPASRQAKVALVFDYEASWITRIQPQGRDFSYTELTYRWYEAARRLGVDVDIVPPGVSLAGYTTVLVPTLPYVSEQAREAFAAAEGTVLFGPRTGSKTRTFQIPPELPPGGLLPLRVTQVASLRPGLAETVDGEVAGHAVRWREWVETALPVRARFADGMPALVGEDRRLYLACWPDPTLLAAVLRKIVPVDAELPAAVRLRRRGDLTFAFNYGDEPWTAPGRDFILGGAEIAPQSLAVWRG
jgi:beta-galactosidase